MKIFSHNACRIKHIHLEIVIPADLVPDDRIVRAAQQQRVDAGLLHRSKEALGEDLDLIAGRVGGREAKQLGHCGDDLGRAVAEPGPVLRERVRARRAGGISGVRGA